MGSDLSTTNMFLGVIAVVSALEALGLLAISVGVVVLIRRVVELINSFETNQIAPAAARVQAILDDVEQMTSTARAGAGWIDKLTTRIFHR